MIYYTGGGVSKENNVRYLTAETPPSGDNSNKVPTTEWVQEKMDDVEAVVSGGMNATVKAVTYTDDGLYGRSYAPSGGGTWWCYGQVSCSEHSTSYNGAYASGAVIHEVRDAYLPTYTSKGFGIKIA